MALAIGAQARASGPIDAQYATACFTRARTIAFEDMLANPSVAVIRLFVLLSFFTLGACRQTPASIYLGIASKAAVVLGMHQPMSRKMMREGNSYYSRSAVPSLPFSHVASTDIWQATNMAQSLYNGRGHKLPPRTTLHSPKSNPPQHPLPPPRRRTTKLQRHAQRCSTTRRHLPSPQPRRSHQRTNRSRSPLKPPPLVPGIPVQSASLRLCR